MNTSHYLHNATNLLVPDDVLEFTVGAVIVKVELLDLACQVGLLRPALVEVTLDPSYVVLWEERNVVERSKVKYKYRGYDASIISLTGYRTV